MKPITTMLWYDGDAEEAANLYLSVFPNSRITECARYPKGAPGGWEGKVMTMAFSLNGAPFVALNGGPQFHFNESVSFVIHCDTQEEVDHYWNALTAGGGQESQCGWLKDKFGVSWQVTPDMLLNFWKSDDAALKQRVMQAMMKMKKLVIADLEAAARG